MVWPAQPPLDPDGATARRLFAEELARPEYQDNRPLLDRVLDAIQEWIGGLFSRVAHGGMPGALALLITAAVLVVIAIGVSRVRHTARVRSPQRPVLEDSRLTAAQWRAAAAAALTAGQADEAYLDYVRAIAKSADERALIAAADAATAREIGLSLRSAFPGSSGEIDWATGVFDAVRYGSQHVTRADVERVRGLDARLESGRSELLGAIR